MAELDLESIDLYGLEAWGEAQMQEYSDRIFSVLDSLSNFPRIGTLHDDLASETRSIGVGHHRIYYRVEHDRIVVMRILHERMNEPDADELMS